MNSIKKFLILVLSVLALTCFTFACGGSGSKTKKDIFLVSGNEIIGLTEYGETLTDLVIPSKINGSKITKISNNAFVGATFTSVTIGDSITSIGEKAFECCFWLTSVTIGDSVTSIGDYAFNGCNKLVEVYNKSNLNIKINSNDYGYVGSHALNIYTDIHGESKLSTDSNGYIIFTDGAEKILVGYNGTSTELVIPSDISKIYKYAFYNNVKITSVIMGDCVINIGMFAFSGCENLIKVTIPNSVSSIDYYAFENCYKLVEIKNNSNLNITKYSSDYGNIGFYALNIYTDTYGASKLSTDSNGYIIYTDGNTKTIVGYSGTSAEIVIPSDVSHINRYAFYNNSIIKRVTISDRVKNIGEKAFEYCYKLVEVYNKSNLNITKGSEDNGGIGYYALNIYTDTSGEKGTFSSGSNDLEFYTYGENVAVIRYNGKDKEIIIPTGVTQINKFAFYNNKKITKVTIPDSVTSIGDKAFDGCSNLVYNINNNLKYLGNSTAPYLYLEGSISTNIATANINANCKIIGDSAFYDCESLINVTMENSVTSIGNYAFYGCESLISVTMGNSVTSIGDYAFYGCYKLTSADLPDSVTSIGDSAFVGCSGLTSVDFPNNVISIGSKAFASCSGLTSVTIGDSVISVGSSAFSWCNGLTSVNYTRDINSWVQISFGDGSANPIAYAKKLYINGEEVTTVNITTATKISAYALYRCKSLTSVTIGDSVTSIGESAFEGCSNLTSVAIPNSVISIGKFAFFDCSSLASVNYTGDIDSWAQIEFGSSNANPITYAEKLYINGEEVTTANITTATKISAYAFYKCKSLTSVTIGDSVTSIGNSAFYECYSITNVNFINTRGWWVSRDSSATSGTTISSSKLANTSTANTYLTATYDDYYWKRS